MPAFTVYSRPGCHLCEVLIEELLPMLRGRAELTVVNIDDDAGLVESHGTRIPVVTFDGQELCHYRLDKPVIEQTLASL